jgi:hypothetical protein
MNVYYPKYYCFGHPEATIIAYSFGWGLAEGQNRPLGKKASMLLYLHSRLIIPQS